MAAITCGVITAFFLCFGLWSRAWYLIATAFAFFCLGSFFVSSLAAVSGRRRERAVALTAFGIGTVLAAAVVVAAVVAALLVIALSWPGGTSGPAD